MSLLNEKEYILDCLKNSKKREKISYENIKEIIKLKGDISPKKFYRIITELGSYIVCLAQDSFLETNQVLTKHKIRIPKIFDYQNNDYFLMQDLGDMTLCDYYHKSSEKSEPFYRQALEELFKFHCIDEDFGLNLKFDYKKLIEEVKTTTSFIEKGNISDSSILRSIETKFSPICQEITKHKMLLCHRDYHSKNIMLYDQKVYLIDFQDMRYGLPQYDLVSLLEDCYVCLDIKLKEELKDLYWREILSSKSYQESRELFESLYDLMNLQRTFKAVGTFITTYQQRGDIYFKNLIQEGLGRMIRVLENGDKNNLKENILEVKDELSHS